MLWMNVFDTTTTTIQCLLISDSVLVRHKYWDCNAVCYTQQLIWKSGIASFHWNDEKSGVKIKTIHWIKDNMSIIKMLFRANLVSKLFIKKQKAKGTDLCWLHKKSGVKTFHRTATSDKSGVEIIHRMASVGRWLVGWLGCKSSHGLPMSGFVLSNLLLLMRGGGGSYVCLFVSTWKMYIFV